MVRKRIAVKRPDGGIVMVFADEEKAIKPAVKPLETASVKPAETATKPKPKAKKRGSGKK